MYKYFLIVLYMVQLMKRLGTVSHIEGHGRLVVRETSGNAGGSLSDLPRIGSVVMDQRVKRIGKVSAIIGPVSNPYITIDIAKDVPFSEVKACVNQKLYVK